MPTATWERLPEERRRAVLRAAEAGFAEHGFSRAGLNIIAHNAGVAKGSLFQYFTDKVDLYASHASCRHNGSPTGDYQQDPLSSGE